MESCHNMIPQRYKHMCAHVMSSVCMHDNRHQGRAYGDEDGRRVRVYRVCPSHTSFYEIKNSGSNNDRTTSADRDTVCLITNQQASYGSSNTSYCSKSLY